MPEDGKVLVIGLDCAAPRLVFDELSGSLPNLERLMRSGTYGGLATCNPPITIPAWLAMFTGRTPGELGLYGFRHRAPGSYDNMWIANSLKIGAPTVWDLAGGRGRRCIVVAVPPSYPPYPVNGEMVSCFLTPDTDRVYTYPESLGEELEELGLSYVPDVEFRVDDKAKLLTGIYDMSEKRFAIMENLMRTRRWDLAVMVEIGLDRIHHGFWKYHDPEHHLYSPGNPFENAITDYYRYLDGEVGRLLDLAGDDATVLVVSDHGAKRMKGAFCLNQWMVEKGYLKLKKAPSGVSSLEDLEVDWAATSAWAWGGYYARVFINLEGREPMGLVRREEYEDFRERLAEEIREIRGPQGEKLENRVWTPDELYPDLKGDPPDLMVVLDDLYWRPAGTLGHSGLFLKENDTGPDDAVHDWQGIYIHRAPASSGRGMRDASIYQVAPIILEGLGLRIPAYMNAAPIGRDERNER